MKKRTYSILIIDDAFFLRNLIKKAIAKKPDDDLDYDFEILTEAQNGEEGLELYQIVKPDIVTVDINMPKLNGIEFIKKLKKLNPYSKIIVISANLASEYKDKAIEAGAFSYIQKPFQDAYLWARLDAIAEELKKESFDISKFSTDNNISNVAIPTIKNNKIKPNPNNQSNKKDNKKIEEGADLLSSIIVGDKTSETINKNNKTNSHKNKNKEYKNHQNKNNNNNNLKKIKKEEKDDSFSFLDSLIVKDTSNKKADVNKNKRNDKKDYVHKKEEKKKSFDKNNKPLNKNKSLENKTNNEIIDISSIIEKEIDIDINKNKEIENIKNNNNDDSLLKDDFSSIDNPNDIESTSDNSDNESVDDKLLKNNNDDELVIDDNEEPIIRDNNEIIINNENEIVIDDDEIIINDDEVIIDNNDEIFIDDNEDEIIIEDNEELVIEDNEEIIVEDEENLVVKSDDEIFITDDNESIDSKDIINENSYHINSNKIDDTNSDNYLEDNITYDIDEFVIPSEIEINFNSQNDIKDEDTDSEEETIVNEKQVKTIDYRSPFSSGSVEFILSSENDEHSADIVHENSYKKEDDNILYNYNNSSNIDNTPKITPPVNNKYKELYNEKMEREYNVSFDDVKAEEPKEEEKLGFFARLFGRKKKKKDKNKKRK